MIIVIAVILGSNLMVIEINNVGGVFALRILILFFLFGLVVYMLTGRNIQVNELKKKTIFIFTSILLYSLLTILWTINRDLFTTSLIIYLISFTLLISCLFLINTREKLQIVINSYVLVVSITCLFAIYESMTGNYFVELQDQYQYYERVNSIFNWHRPRLFFDNINNLAFFIALSSPLTLISFRNIKYRFVVRTLILFLILFVTILIGSRASFSMFAIMILAYIVFSAYSLRKYIKFIMMFSFLILGFIILMNLEWILSELRVLIWLDTLLSSFEYFGMGVGPGNASELNRFYGEIDTKGVYAVHNFFLEFFAEFGFIGLFLLLYWFYYVINSLWKYIKLNYDRNMMITFIAILMAFFIGNVGPSHLQGMYFIWFIFGIIISAINLCENERKVLTDN